jgi:hypothetical protein
MAHVAASQDGSPIARLPPVTHAECLTLRNILLRTHPASQWEAGFIESMASLLQEAARRSSAAPPAGFGAGD